MHDTVSHTQLLMQQANDPPGIGAASSRFKPQPGLPNQRPPMSGRRLSEWTPINQVVLSRYDPPQVQTNYPNVFQNIATNVAAALIVAGVLGTF